MFAFEILSIISFAEKILSTTFKFSYILYHLEQCQLKSVIGIKSSYGTFTQCVKKEGTEKDHICCGFLNFVF